MTPRKEILAEGVEIWLGDCREVLPLIGKVDAVVTDPPYGNRHSGDSSRFSGGQTRRGRGSSHGRIVGDGRPFDPSHIFLGSTQIIWGANYFPQALQPGSFLVWAKRRPFTYGTFLGDGEVAWFSRGTGVYLFEFIFAGSSAAIEYTADAYAQSAHPFQKPIELMKWCLEKVPDADTILDPYMGSGTTGVACVNLGRKFIGVEIEERYFSIARRRISEALRQPRLPLSEPVKAVQESLAL